MAKGNQASRRGFFGKALGGAALAAFGAGAARAHAASGTGVLSVWSCGGLAEALGPALADFENQTGARVAYTGAFAAALGKSLLGPAQTDVFAGRVLDLAKKLRTADKMAWFKPLCFTSYVLVVPKGNPAGVRTVADMARDGVRPISAPEASPPGGAAADAILKKAGVFEAVNARLVARGTCVQRTIQEVVERKADVCIVERRLAVDPRFAPYLESIDIPDALFPPGPLTFTIGVMKNAKDPDLAARCVQHLLAPAAQGRLALGGFIPALSERGAALVDKLGVRDV